MKKEKKAFVDDKIFKEYNKNNCLRCGNTYFVYKALCRKCKDGLESIWLEIHEKIRRKQLEIEYNKTK